MAKVLLIEDDPDNRDLVRITLQINGHEVHEATTAEEGIKRARQLMPDIIIMDLSLPGKFDGLQATRQLRADPQFDCTPIVALTAHVMRGDRERALEAGCDDHWMKPIVDLKGFAAAVAELAARGRRSQSADRSTTEPN